MLLTACSINPVTGSADLVFVSEEQELEIMGERFHPQLVKYFGGEYDDQELKAYIVEIGNRLAAQSHRSHLVYHFTILDTPIVNAFATPGYIYITRGMLAYLNSEAELAAVLGHEMGHITARHSVKQHARGQLASILTQVVAQVQDNVLLPDLLNLINTVAIRGYGRKAELEADRLGIEYATEIGYSPEQMQGVLRVLKAHESFEKQLAKEQNRQPNVYHGIFATHPDSEMRLRKAAAAAVEYQDRSTAFETRRQEYLDMIQGLVYGSSSKEGIVKNNSFYHADLGITFTFPENWIAQNTPTQFAVKNLQDTVQVLLRVEDRNRKQTPAEFLRRRFRNIEADTLMPLHAGLSGQTAILKRVVTPYGSRKARIAVMLSDNKVFKFLAVAKDPHKFAANDPVFLEIMESLRPLKKEEYALAQPLEVVLLTVKEEDTITSFVRQSAFPHHKEEFFRLLNGIYPTGDLKVGQVIKTVQ